MYCVSASNTVRCNTIYISPDYDLHLGGLRFITRRTKIFISADYDLHLEVSRFDIKSCTARTYREVRRINVWSPSSPSVLISVVTDPTVLWNLSSFPATSDSLRANFQSRAVVQPVRPLVGRFPQLEFRTEKPVRCHNYQQVQLAALSLN